MRPGRRGTPKRSMRPTRRNRSRLAAVRCTIPAAPMRRLASAAAVTLSVVPVATATAIVALAPPIARTIVAPVTILVRGPALAIATFLIARRAHRATPQLPPPPRPRAIRDAATRAAAAARRAIATRPLAAAPVALAVAVETDTVDVIDQRRRAIQTVHASRKGNDRDRGRRRLRTNSSDARMWRLRLLSLLYLPPCPLLLLLPQRLLSLRLLLLLLLLPLLVLPTARHQRPPLAPLRAAPCRPCLLRSALPVWLP
jgi:hypothetical protein